MLGGGNPASIPAMLDYFHQASADMLTNGTFVDAMANYDGPQGKDTFIKSLAKLLKESYGWDISEKNISLTNGSQSAFFYLFNLLAGQQTDGSHKKILLPLAPEYIGYSDSGVDEDIFVSYRPEVSMLENGMFKYHVDFEHIQVDESVAAICASRPTNPTGNVLTDEEIKKLDELARENNVPLIIDNAYGTPFPNIIFEEVTPFWNDNTILCMSLSKLGLPGVRCGIIIANEEVTQAITNINGIVSLAPSGIGPAIGSHMIESGDLLQLSQKIVRPFYQQKAQHAIELLQQHITDPRFRIHKPEGAIFLWLWFDELPIATKELYARLKARGVLVIPGEYFFFGLDCSDWEHTRQCIRMNYVQDEKSMQDGIKIIAEEVMKAYQEAQELLILKMAKKYVVMGVSGCGKSLIGKTLANALDIPFIDGDDYHTSKNVQKMREGIPLTDSDRQEWLWKINAILLSQPEVVIACSALKSQYRSLLSKNCPELKFIYLKGDYQTIWARYRNRKYHYFQGADMLKSQFSTLEEPTDEEAIHANVTHTPEKIVADILHQIHHSKDEA